MFNNHTYSLEEVATGFGGEVINPTICDQCYQAIHQERHARSCPRSYAAVAESEYRYQVLDWKGRGTNACRCCGSREYSSRYTAELHRKSR